MPQSRRWLQGLQICIKKLASGLGLCYIQLSPMTKIKALNAVVYNPQKVKDLSKVVCPPYDVISPQRQDFLHSRHPHNFIHILLGKDIPGEDKYQRAAELFQAWVKEHVLIQEEKPAVYFYSQQYRLNGAKKNRFGFIALMRLEDKGSAIFEHENTRVVPKEDRMRLLKAVRANLSPIFAVVADKKRIIPRIFQDYILAKEPMIEVMDEENTVHKIWRLDTPEVLQRIELAMQQEDVFIADGHHRYEVACAYRKEMAGKVKNPTGEESYNYVLTYFTNTDPLGLTILPIHRLVRLPSPVPMEKFIASAGKYFDIEEMRDKTRFFFLLAKCGQSEHVLGMYAYKRFWLLRVKNVKMADKLISNKPKEYRSLDVSLFNYLILKEALGLPLDDLKESVIYNHDAEELIAEVNANPGSMAFFLNPVKIEQIMKVALAGEKMPPKSTFFYPKVLSGLVIHTFKE